MIFVTNTPNNAGVAVYGDYKDFEELYEALHTVVGEDYEYKSAAVEYPEDFEW